MSSDFTHCKQLLSRYVHYRVDGPTIPVPKDFASSFGEEKKMPVKKFKAESQEATILYPPQWVQCDLRYLDMTVLGKVKIKNINPLSDN
jgi:mRNA (2'-O-methyladenosine-N6-)-methyltransferase